MRPIDFCTPKPFQLEHSCSAVSQRGDLRAMPCGTTRRPPSYRSLSTPCSFSANVSFRALLHPSGDERCRYREARGRPIQNEAGENRASRRGSHFGDRTILTRRRFLPPCGVDTDRLWHPCRLLLAACAGRVSSTRRLRLGGRQDRFRGGLVKGVRFADPGCLPPTVAARTPLAPKHERNHAAFIEDAALT